MRSVTADLVFTGGEVFTADAVPRRVTAVAVAVGAGRVIGMGHDRDVADLAGPSTEIIDLTGRLLLPGFQDSHIHPATAGLDMARCSLHEASDAVSALDAIARYAESRGTGWILGGGWAMDWFPGGTPSAASLDAVVSDRPVFLRNRDGHGAWVNGTALEVAGISASTPDPPDGRIERLEDGRPQGTFHEGAMALVDHVLPEVTVADYEDALSASQNLLLSLGVTAWQDAAVDGDIHAAYRSVAGRGRLRVDVVGALWWDRDRGLEQVAELTARREEPAPRYRPTSVKIMLDGVAENFTASMLAPYLDGDGAETGNSGIDFVDPAALPAIVTRLDAEGFQVHFHAIGDRAVRNALDAVEAARNANGWRDTRHHIAHIQVIHPADLPRFGRLGVVANAQPYWACADGYQTDLTIPFIGPERATMQYPFRSLLRHGATLAMGSDWSVSTPNPLIEMEVAVERVLPERRGDEPFIPDERISLGEAMAAFTIGSAYVNHRDAESGSIEVGKEADLIVLDRNPFDPEAGAVGEARVELTIIGGDLVYQREAAS